MTCYLGKGCRSLWEGKVKVARYDGCTITLIIAFSHPAGGDLFAGYLSPYLAPAAKYIRDPQAPYGYGRHRGGQGRRDGQVDDDQYDQPGLDSE